MNKHVCISLALLVALAGCGKKEAETQPAKTEAPPKGKYVLAAEPAGGKGVLEVRKEGKNGDEVVIVGRVGGSVAPLTKDRAFFTIVDASLKPCNEKPGDNCETPWDYCCDPKETLRAATATIKFVDANGRTLEHDAADWLGVQPLQTVVVHGKLLRDAKNDLTVQASELFIRPAASKEKP